MMITAAAEKCAGQGWTLKRQLLLMIIERKKWPNQKIRSKSRARIVHRKISEEEVTQDCLNEIVLAH